MNRFVPLVLATSLIGCGGSPDFESVDRGSLTLSTGATLLPLDPKRVAFSCKAPNERPVYQKPADDSVALGSLLEGAGYGASSNSDWTDIAAGNFCGGPEKELVLLKNRHSNFSILRGPTPYAVGASDLLSNSLHPWRATAAGNLDTDSFDEIVAIRKVTAAGVPDVVVTKVDNATCEPSRAIVAATIGNPANSDWIDAAIGNFDGTGKQVALLKAAHSNLFLAKVSGAALNVVFSSDLDSNAAYPWKALAAGDLDGDGLDELVAARRVSDGRAATVLVYKWSGTTFALAATSSFGNTGNSEWSGMAVGDFNADGRAAIALVKNRHSSFAVLDLPSRSKALRVVSTADLDSVAGQNWRGLAATDWLGSDQGAAELVAVRAAKAPYRADLFVYGNPFHRISRDTGLEGTKGQWDQERGQDLGQLMTWVSESHTNMVNWHLGVGPSEELPKGDYRELVEFLERTKDYCVDGRQLRVWVTLVAPFQAELGNCSLPQESTLTPWNELDYFTAGPNGDPLTLCKDLLGWGSVIGRLAQDYPHLVALGIDDFLNRPEEVSEEVIAEMQSRMRSQAPWLSFVPTGYYHTVRDNPKDMARTFDTMVYYFRNEKTGQCLGGACGEASVANAPGEYEQAIAFLPEGRKLQVGVYWVPLYPDPNSPPDTPSIRYDYDLTRLDLNLPWLGGVTAYSMQRKTSFVCDEINFLNDRFCTLQKVFGGKPQPVSDTDLTIASGAPLAAGDPFGYVFKAQGMQNVVYRATDGHAHELWRTATGIGHSDLTALAGAPGVVGDPKAYVFDAQGFQNVVYRGTDGRLHGLYWSTGAVGHDDLTSTSPAPLPAGDPTAYFVAADGTHHVVYRGSDGHVHNLSWTTGVVAHDDLTVLAGAPAAAGNPSAYVAPDGTQHVIYRSSDGHLHDLVFGT